jgi:threonine/homoserine/homoserine lactone efflux protein
VLSTRGNVSPATLFWFLIAFLVGALVWSAVFSTFASLGRRYARPAVFRALDGICGAIIGYFGVRLAWSSLRRLVRLV